MQLQPVAQSQHDELLALLNPLLNYMISSGYNYFLVAGKDNTCTRHLCGTYEDVEAMISGMCQNNKQVAVMLKQIAGNLK